jgi:xanthine dehydrogenase YagR molybdenum-binding subunit
LYERGNVGIAIGEQSMATSVIGKGVNRIDGWKKLTGSANYAVDRSPEGMVHSYGVMSTIANGKIVKIDASRAEASEGVVVVFYPGRFPKVYRSPNEDESATTVSEVRPPFEDDRICYAGQFVALVIARTFEQARDAAPLVKIEYAEETPITLWRDNPKVEPQDQSKRGNPEEAFAQAEVKHEATYETPVETHNPMEMHGSVAWWEGPTDSRSTVRRRAWCMSRILWRRCRAFPSIG